MQITKVISVFVIGMAMHLAYASDLFILTQATICLYE